MMENLNTKNATLLAKDYDYKKYINMSIQWNYWFLKPIGIWPKSLNNSKTEKYISRLINTTCYFLLCFLLIPCGTFVILEVKDLHNKIRLFGPLSFCVMAILKYYSLNFRENQIRECLKCIEWDWKNISCLEDRNIMTVNAKFGRKLSVICSFFMYSGVTFYYIILPISVGTVTAGEENLTFVPLVYPFSEHIIDTHRTPTNEILFLMQFLAGFLMHTITAAACSLASALVTHACGQVEILTTWLKHLVNGRLDMCKNVDGRIASIVNQHVRILRFLALVEETLQQISFIDIVGSTLNLCLLGYYIIGEWSSNDLTAFITYIVLLVSLTFNIFIFCYLGELVAEHCKKIGEESYMIHWYRLTGKRKLCIILVIAMSNTSIKLTAGNIVVLSLTTFSDVIKTSVAYLNMLRAVT